MVPLLSCLPPPLYFLGVGVRGGTFSFWPTHPFQTVCILHVDEKLEVVCVNLSEVFRHAYFLTSCKASYLVKENIPAPYTNH